MKNFIANNGLKKYASLVLQVSKPQMPLMANCVHVELQALPVFILEGCLRYKENIRNYKKYLWQSWFDSVFKVLQGKECKISRLFRDLPRDACTDFQRLSFFFGTLLLLDFKSTSICPRPDPRPDLRPRSWPP